MLGTMSAAGVHYELLSIKSRTADQLPHYLLAAIGTAGNMFAMMSLPKSGPFIPGDISFIGSLLLLVAAVTALFRFRGTGYISLAGVLIVWVPYLSLFIRNGMRGGTPSVARDIAAFSSLGGVPDRLDFRRETCACLN